MGKGDGVHGKARDAVVEIMNVSKATEQACMACLDSFMNAVNAYDVDAMERQMHFPHVRIATGDIKEYAAPGSNPLDLFARLREDDNWSHSIWISKAVVQGNAEKVHVAVRYARVRADGSIIGEYESLYILATKQGRWGIVARSSFGP